MKKRFFLAVFTAALIQCVAAQAETATPSTSQQDRERAVLAFTDELKQQCQANLAVKRGVSSIAFKTELVFNDMVTQEVRDHLFWQPYARGVAFTTTADLPNRADTGIACFYAISDEGELAFQSSQVMNPAYVQQASAQ